MNDAKLPLDDRDDDGVPDAVDRCPDARETINGYDDVDGCPDELPTSLTDCFPSSPHYIHFASAGTGRLTIESLRRASTLDARGRATVDGVVHLFREYPELRVEISGHADAHEGRSVEDRHAISLARAAAVRDDLMARHGIDGRRIEVRAAGDAEPLDGNDRADGRARNRRTQFMAMPP